MSGDSADVECDKRPGRKKQPGRPLTADEIKVLEPGDILWLARSDHILERGIKDCLGPEYYWCINHPFLFLRWTTYGDRYCYVEGCPVSLNQCCFFLLPSRLMRVTLR